MVWCKTASLHKQTKRLLLFWLSYSRHVQCIYCCWGYLHSTNHYNYQCKSKIGRGMCSTYCWDPMVPWQLWNFPPRAICTQLLCREIAGALNVYSPQHILGCTLLCVLCDLQQRLYCTVLQALQKDLGPVPLRFPLAAMAPLDWWHCHSDCSSRAFQPSISQLLRKYNFCLIMLDAHYLVIEH